MSHMKDETIKLLSCIVLVESLTTVSRCSEVVDVPYMRVLSSAKMFSMRQGRPVYDITIIISYHVSYKVLH